jgi:hypothetical protein
MDKNNFLSDHLLLAALGAGSTLPEIVDERLGCWWLLGGAAMGWVIWRAPRWWAWWTRVGS